MYETWFFFSVIHPIPVPKSARVCFHQLIFGIQPYAVPNLTASVFYSVPFSGPGVLKNLNKCKLFLFSHFVQVFLPKGLLRIIQNPNNPNRHKCQWQSCGIFNLFQSLCAWRQFQTVRLHWLSRAFVHRLARHTVQLALHYRQAQRHRWRFPCYLIAFSSQRVGRNVPGFEALKAITSSIKHLCATGVASIVGVAIFYEPIVYKHKRGDLSINKFSLRNFVKLKVSFSN